MVTNDFDLMCIVSLVDGGRVCGGVLGLACLLFLLLSIANYSRGRIHHVLIVRSCRFDCTTCPSFGQLVRRSFGGLNVSPSVEALCLSYRDCRRRPRLREVEQLLGSLGS